MKNTTQTKSGGVLKFHDNFVKYRFEIFKYFVWKFMLVLSNYSIYLLEVILNKSTKERLMRKDMTKRNSKLWQIIVKEII